MAKKSAFGLYLVSGPVVKTSEYMLAQIGTALRTGKSVTLITWSPDPTAKLKLSSNTDKFRVVVSPTMRASLMDAQSGMMAEHGLVFVDGVQRCAATGTRWDQAGSLLRVLSNRHESSLHLLHHVSDAMPEFPYLDVWAKFLDSNEILA